ncbi:kelch repeat and BTB domain-containing protein 8-like [Branchiostoma floridae]|uniref:Kelch repeat and BTB domain-containing protein 8-like n=1 Tax=Branchiostoma floridae TaxID=7739 RepID=A0A9J7LUV2_BRAFL|nr:kelch repeat and BTB domain-containing protein 8-like [Branchiostoma floridae]
MFTSDMAESRQKTVVLQGLDADMLGEILSYIYSGTLHVFLDKVQPLYQAADLLQLDYVRDTCSSYMAMNVERSTCVELYKFADVFSVDIVQNRCLQLIHRNFVEIAFSKEFSSLSVNQLTEIISHDELDAKVETTVWEAVVRWVQHSREDRLHHLPSILQYIRFNLLTSDDTAAILVHNLVREDPGSSEYIRNVVQKSNHNLKPRLGLTMEMAMLYNSDNSECGSNEILFMNPQEGKYISCSYKPGDFPDYSPITVTSDNNIYMLETKELEDENQVSLFKYNHAKNVWENMGMSSVSKAEEDFKSYNKPSFFEVDGTLYHVAVYHKEKRHWSMLLHMKTRSTLLQIRKYNRHTNQWQECAQLQLDGRIVEFAVLPCGPNIYFLTNTEIHRYDPSQDRWSKRTPPILIPDVCTAVAMGTDIFLTDFFFTQTTMYDTESDCWQKLQGWPDPGDYTRDVDNDPRLFVLENQLHILLTCRRNSRQGEVYLVYVYDKSADAWRDLKANLPDIDKDYCAHAPHCPVARISLRYLKGI